MIFFHSHVCFLGERQFDGILPKGPYPPCLRMAERAFLAGYTRITCPTPNTHTHTHTHHTRQYPQAVPFISDSVIVVSIWETDNMALCTFTPRQFLLSINEWIDQAVELWHLQIERQVGNTKFFKISRPNGSVGPIPSTKVPKLIPVVLHNPHNQN